MNNLRQLRKAAGLSQEGLGALIGKSGAAVGRYENGKRPISASVLRKLTMELKCNKWDIVGDSDREPLLSDFDLDFIQRTKSSREAAGFSIVQMSKILEIIGYEYFETEQPLPHEYIRKFCFVCEVGVGWLFGFGNGEDRHLPDEEIPVRPIRRVSAKGG